MKVRELLESVDAFKEAKRVNCPLCGAKGGSGCVGAPGTKNEGSKLSTLHNERLRAAGFGSAKDFKAKAKPVAATEKMKNLTQDFSKSTNTYRALKTPAALKGLQRAEDNIEKDLE